MHLGHIVSDLLDATADMEPGSLVAQPDRIGYQTTVLLLRVFVLLLPLPLNNPFSGRSSHLLFYEQKLQSKSRFVTKFIYQSICLTLGLSQKK